MYKATVEAVSGLKVRAGGKWLTCIGNRAVKVGDRIWTDGRCAYGHDRETQAPIVVSSPTKEDLAIPIQIVSRGPSEMLFTYRKNKLEQVPSGEYTGRLLNDTKGHVYYSTADAAEIDSAGNIYIIDGSKANYDYSGGENTAPDYGSYVDCDNPHPSLSIRKNGRLVNEVSLEDVIESNASIARKYAITYAPSLPEDFIEPSGDSTHGDAFFWSYYQGRFARLLYASIENERSWAVIYQVQARYTCYCFWWTWGEGYYPGAPMWLIDLSDYVSAGFYCIDSTGERKLLCQTGYGTHKRRVGERRYTEDLNTPPITVIGTDSVNFPIQDGFYFKAEYSFPQKVLALGFPTVKVKYSFYSSTGKYLCSWEPSEQRAVFIEVYNPWSFAMCKLDKGKYLLGVGRLGTDFDFEGLYICEGGKLVRQQNTRCMNYRLRPMKRYKNWWERVQLLE